MSKRIIGIWKNDLPELYMMMGYMMGLGLFGSIGMLVAMQFADEEEPLIALGAFMAAMVWILTGVFLGVFRMTSQFNHVVSLGCTRREYVLGKVITSYLHAVIAIALIVLYSFLEKMLFAVFYGDRECIAIADVLWNKQLLFAVILLFPSAKLFFGSLVVKFKNAALVLYFGCWIGSCIGIGKAQALFPVIQGVAVGLPDALFAAGVFLLAGVMLALTYCILKKQAVYA